MKMRATQTGLAAGVLTVGFLFSTATMAQPADPPAPPADAPPTGEAPPADAPPADAPPTDAPPADAPPADAPPADAPPADAPPADAPADAPPADAPADPAAAAAAPTDPAAAAPTEDQTAAVDDARQGNSPVELANKSYYFVGARYRNIIVPKFMMNLFGQGGRTVFLHSGGVEAAIRKNDFEYNFGLWFAKYFMKETPFKASGDPITAWEVVKSDLNVLYFTTDFLWTFNFTPEFGLNYGASVGFGYVFGDLFRTQSYPPDGDPNSPKRQWVKCIDQFNPPAASYGATEEFCDDENNHFGGFTEPNWANGGDTPIIFPWLYLMTGFRIKPHRNFVTRIDLGFGTSGFLLGIGLDYGI